MDHQILIALMLWVVALWRAPSLRLTPKQRSIALAFLGLAAAMTFEIPAVSERAQILTGVDSVGYLLKHLLGLIAAASVLEFVITVVHPDGFFQRTRRTFEATSLAVMTTTFLLAPVGDRIPDAIVVAHDVSKWALLCDAVFRFYLGAAMTVTAILFAHAARHTHDNWVRAGHSLLGFGGVLGVLYTLLRLMQLVHVASGDAASAGIQPPGGVPTALKFSAIAAIVVGSSVSPISIAATKQRERRALRQIEPLWRGLTDAVPAVVLALDPGLARPHLLLHRRLVEISDATLRLRVYIPVDVQARALDMAEQAGRPAEIRSAVAEAAWLKTAVALAPTSSPQAGEHPQPGGGGLSPAAELRWIRQVSRAFDALPEVAAFAQAEAAAIRETNRKQPA